MFETECFIAMCEIPRSTRQKAAELVVWETPEIIADRYQKDTGCDDVERLQVKTASECYMSIFGGCFLIGAAACLLLVGKGAFDIGKLSYGIYRHFRRR